MSTRQRGHQLYRGCQPFLQVDEPQTRGGGGRYIEVPVPGGCAGAHVDSNDDTAGHCVRGTRRGQVLEPWTGELLNDGDVGHTLPASHERVGYHVR